MAKVQTSCWSGPAASGAAAAASPAAGARRVLSSLTLGWFEQIPPEQAQTGEAHLKHHQPSPHAAIS